MSKEQSYQPNEAIKPSVKRKPSFGVNLSDEVDNIREHGDAYYPNFKDNLLSFTKETDTHARMFHFQHSIERQPDGTVRLYLDDTRTGIDKSNQVRIEARTSYLKGALEPSLPDWERARNMKDYEAVVALERMLEMAQPGDTFIESSPAPFDQSDEALEGTFYGRFSFIRTHTVGKNTDGRDVLKGQAARHYLDWKTQTELHADLTGANDITPETLYARIDKLSPRAHLADVEDIGDIAAYIRSFDSESFVTHDGNDASGPDEAAIDDYLDATQCAVEDVFKRLKRTLHPTPTTFKERQRIKELIKLWRQSVRDFCNGIDRRDEIIALFNSQKKHVLGKQTSYTYDYYDDRAFSSFQHMYREYAFSERYNSCGIGIGFGDATAYGVALEPGMAPSYVNLSYMAARMEGSKPSGPDQRVVTCPSCNKEVTFSREHVIKSQELKCSCGACAKGCDVEAIAYNSRPVKSISYENMDTPIAA